MIGIGHRGGSLIKQVLAQPNVKITAVCDTDAQARDNAQSVAKRDNPRSFVDYRQVLDLKEVDAVVVATPCDLHAPMAAAALQAGKYIYCEKPVGITAEQVSMVLAASRKSKTFLQIGQQLRYVGGLRSVIQQLRDGVIGQTYVIRANRGSTPPTEQAENARPAWYKDVKRSGDLIVENAVHNLDVCNWVANSHPTSAYGHGKKYFPTPQPAGTLMMDGFCVEYIYDNDMHLDYSQLYMQPRTLKDLPSGQWYFVMGEKGTVDLTKGIVYGLDGSEPRPLIPADQRGEKEDAMSQFMACIRENRKPFADIKVAATAALTAILGREAIYRRKSVTWKELGVEV
ncbi:MAG TPA: Gfo/Idh/MocA family oxidoreductase [Bryobacteraceae bacterium]|nr:Gfo/Idh/MocA family oxidoreductase [Bryobacteraceae bacterium]